ncbi:MAG: DUF354 domain-containing protein [Candidatus Altiarchaeota archaeon]
MKIQIDIGHPAHVHYFKNLIWDMERKGHEFAVTARNKEIIHHLLRAYGIKYTDRGSGSPNILGKIIYLPKADMLLYKVATAFKPDMFLSFGSMYAAHASRLVGRPHIAFDDTEKATLGRALYAPFTDMICTPSCFTKELGKRKHRRYNGFIELCYLHPKRFKPDRKILDDIGVGSRTRFHVVRFVSWGASHDVGETGLRLDEKRRLINLLEKDGDVYITSEGKLPAEFEKYRLPVKPEQIHHLLAYATLYFGESPTMATESAILGTPAICVNSWACDCGNFNELKKYDLIGCYHPRDFDRALDHTRKLLSRPGLKAEWARKRDKLLEDKIDVTAWMMELIEGFIQTPH